MSIEDIFLVRFDFIKHSKASELENALESLFDTKVSLLESLKGIDSGYVEVDKWRSTEHLNEECYEELSVRIYSYREYILVQTRIDLSNRALPQWFRTNDGLGSQSSSSTDTTVGYSQIASDLNQICSRYPSLVNQFSSGDFPIILHCSVGEPPGTDSIEEWVKNHKSPLRELGFTQTSGLQTVVNGTYLVSLQSFPKHGSGLIVVNIFTKAQNILSSDAERFFRITSRYHLAHYALAEYEQLIKSRAEPSLNTNKILRKKQIDDLIEIETTLINQIEWCNDLLSELQSHSPFLRPEKIPEEQTVSRNENAELAETTYFEYYRSELDEYHQKLVNTIKNERSHNDRLLGLVRDRVSAIGVQKNIKLQKRIYILTVLLAIASGISLLAAFDDEIVYVIRVLIEN